MSSSAGPCCACRKAPTSDIRCNCNPAHEFRRIEANVSGKMKELLCAAAEELSFFVGSGSQFVEIRVRGCCSLSTSNVEVRREFGVRLDEQPPRLDFVAHEPLEHLVRGNRIFDVHLQERATLRIHCGLEELSRVHLAESLVALHVDIGSAVLAAATEALRDVVSLFQVEGVVFFLPLRDAEE